MVQNMFYFIFLTKYREIMKNYLPKRFSIDPFYEERNCHGKIKTFYEISTATEIIRCPTRLLKVSNVNTDDFIFSSSPVNIASYLPQKNTFVFVQKKKKKTEHFLQTAKLLFQGILTAWKHSDKGIKLFKQVQCGIIISTVHELLVK